MYGIAALAISSSSFTLCYTIVGVVSAWLGAMVHGVMVHGAVRAGGHACMHIVVVVLAVVAQPT